MFKRLKRTVNDGTDDLMDPADVGSIRASISGCESLESIVLEGWSGGREDRGGRSCKCRPSEGPGNAAKEKGKRSTNTVWMMEVVYRVH